MRKIILGLVFILTDVIFIYSEVPQIISYQGTLRKNGVIYDGAISAEFRITNYDGSIIWWTSGSTNVFVSAGLFRYPLGKPNESNFQNIPWSSTSTYVEVYIDGNLLSREPIFSTPYSIHSKTSEGSKGSFVVKGSIIVSTNSTGGIFISDGVNASTVTPNGFYGKFYGDGSNLLGIQATVIGENVIYSTNIVDGEVKDVDVYLTTGAIKSGKWDNSMIANIDASKRVRS